MTSDTKPKQGKKKIGRKTDLWTKKVRGEIYIHFPSSVITLTVMDQVTVQEIIVFAWGCITHSHSYTPVKSLFSIREQENEGRFSIAVKLLPK